MGITIEYLENEIDVYDITVEDNHNFFANDVLVHNCTEIIEYSDSEETAVCNLASIALPKFVDIENKTFNYDELVKVTKTATLNLNKVIDKNYYPTKKTKKSNMRHRPIGLGVQGLADVFFKLGIAYDSAEAAEINKNIFESIYYAAVEASMELAQEDGAYETFIGSPASEGILQFDLWGVKPSDRYDWDALKDKVKKHGMRNSLLVAPMPTASTAQILGNIEAFEAQTSNLFKRQTLAGEFIVINKYLVAELEKLGLWTSTIRNKIMLHNGSIQNISEIPQKIKDIYKTIWEISQKTIIDMAADRGPYIDQSQSLNLWLAQPNFGKINSMHFYGWEKGLKTGMYYLRSRPAADAQKVTTIEEKEVEKYDPNSAIACSIDNPEDCEACGS